MRRRICYWAAFLLFASLGICAQSAPESAENCAPPYKTFSYANVLGSSPIFFSHGYIVQYKHRIDSKGKINIRLYEPSGQIAHEIATWPEGVSDLFLASVDIGANGRLAFAGWATNDDGRPFDFIASSDLDGSKTQYFSTGSYRPTLIAQADDGSIWAIGAEQGDRSVVDHTTWKNYDSLRHYSPTGVVLDHFLPRWGPLAAYATANTDHTISAYDNRNNLIRTYKAPTWGPTFGYNRAWAKNGGVYLRSEGSRTVVYDGPNNRLCIHDRGVKTISCREVVGDTVSQMAITGFALTATGAIFASIDSNDSPGLSRLVLLSSEPNGEHSRWRPITGGRFAAHADNGFVALLGADETSLVLSTID